MDKKSKVISGLKAEKIIIKKPNKYFTNSEKHQIIQELLNSGCTKREIWEKYTGQEEEHGQLLRWMRQLGYNTGIKTRRPNFIAYNDTVMAKKKIKSDKPVNLEDESFENLQLKKRINGIIKDEYLDAYEISNIKQAKELLDSVISLYNSERPHMSISNLTPNHIHQSKTKIKTER